MNRPATPASTASSVATLFGPPPSPGIDRSAAIPDDLLATLAKPEPPTPVMECKHASQAVYLAPTPMSFITNLRYERRDKLNYGTVQTIEMVPPINGIKFRSDSLGTLGWRSYEHPEGSVYFRAENFYTNLWLYDAATLEAIEEVVRKLRAELASHPQLSDSHIEFGLDLIDDDEPGAGPGDKLGCYYAVNKTTEEVFWLHEVPQSFFCNSVQINIISREHLRYGAGMSYWDHCYMFPDGRSLSSNIIKRLQAMLSYNMFDKITSATSVLPYSYDDAQRLRHVFQDVEASNSSGQYICPEHIIMIARMQSTLLRDKLLCFHGERFAQLDSNKSVFEEDPKHKQHSGLFEAISRLLFSTPHVYYKLNRIWVDEKVNYDSWGNFIRELQTDWAAYIIPATITFTANIAFLGIRSVDEGNAAANYRTIGQVSSYISTLLNIECVIASLMLAEQHRLSTHRHSEYAITYLCDRASSKGGVERLAILFSIPAAFFRWGFIAFSVTIFWSCWNNTSGATRIPVGVVGGISCLFLVAIVCNGDWKLQPNASPLATGAKKMCQLLKQMCVFVATLPPSRFRSPQRRSFSGDGNDQGTLV